MELIQGEILKIRSVMNKFEENVSNDKAFIYLYLYIQYYGIDDIVKNIIDIKECVTDGNNDGGIDFVYFDEEEEKVIVGQGKYYDNTPITKDIIIESLRKMLCTIRDFEEKNTGKYNSLLKEKLQNALDRLTEENIGNIEYIFFSTGDEISGLSFSNDKILKDEIENISIIGKKEINRRIEEVHTELRKVDEDKIKLDKPKNVLEYDSDNMEGIFVNVSSKSLVNIYNKYKSKGLFDLNIRKFIPNKNVDEGIKKTLDNNRQNFWFLNNGLTIACSDYDVDGDVVKLEGFSIVNGGQTTNRIGEYKGRNTDEFFIPCKIIKEKSKNTKDFFSKIAEATNSQKPIQPRDLKSNSPEMRLLKKILEQRGIDLEIKRGEKKKKDLYKIKNDELAQIIYSFVNQKPGTVRSSKKTLFSNNKIYKRIFYQNYPEESNKKAFLFDLIDLNKRFEQIKDKLKQPGELEKDELNILSNGKYTLFALFGITYCLQNNDYTIYDIKEDVNIIDQPFVYGSFISNYRKDDLEDKLEDLVRFFLALLAKEYEDQYYNGKVTSVSNFFKTDLKYMNNIVKSIINSVSRRRYQEEFDTYRIIFERK